MFICNEETAISVLRSSVICENEEHINKATYLAVESSQNNNYLNKQCAFAMRKRQVVYYDRVLLSKIEEK